MGMEILYALEKLRTPLLDGLFGAITYLGDEMVFMAIAIILYWCVSKKWGYYLLCVGFFGTLVNQFAKILCRVPRPWVRDPGFSIVESARAAATGYSFPSGHAACITSSMGCIARFSGKKWLRAVCIAVLLLVCFSRMYLGVHYPTDVAFSIVVGLILVFAAYPLFAKSDENPQSVYWTVAVLTLLALAYALFTELHRFPADTDPENLASAVKSGWMLTGCGAGMLLSLWIDKRYVNFDVKAVWWAQVLKVVIGLGLVIGIRVGLKPILRAVFGTALFPDAIRYFCIVVFAAGIWPMTFRRFARLGRKK